MKRAYVLGLLAILTFAVPLLGQTGKITTNGQVPIPSPFDDRCTGESIAFDGTITIETTTWTDANGAAHSRMRQLPINVVGTGLTTGLPYRLIASGTIVSFVGAEGLPFTETAIFQQLLIAKGAPPDNVVLTLFHITVNADGNTTSEIDKMIDKCTGTH